MCQSSCAEFQSSWFHAGQRWIHDPWNRLVGVLSTLAGILGVPQRGQEEAATVQTLFKSSPKRFPEPRHFEERVTLRRSPKQEGHTITQKIQNNIESQPESRVQDPRPRVRDPNARVAKSYNDAKFCWDAILDA